MGKMREKLTGLLTPYYTKKYVSALHHKKLELWVTAADTDAFEEELYTRDDGSTSPNVESLRTWEQLFGYPVRWDMPKTEAVIVG